VQNYGATCYAIDEKQPADGYMRQIPGPYTQPVGPAGGPLQGSSLAGPPPAAIPAPAGLFEHPLLALGLVLAAGQGPLEPPKTSPSLGALDPGEAAIGDPDLTLTLTGANFADTSVIVFNGGDEPTTFVSETELTTTVKPSTATVAGSFPVLVRNANGEESNAVDFTFTESQPVTRKRKDK
jgi:hypothetical protein